MRFYRIILLLIIYVQVSSFACFAQNKAEVIEQILNKFHEYENFQGAILVAEAGEVLYRGAYGLANREWNIPNTTDTKFNIASLSKQFTAMLILQLVEEGRIDLDSTINAYYPAYRKDIGTQVTIKQLLSHQSGIPNYTSLPYVWSDSLLNRYTKEDIVKKFGSGELEFAPGSRYQYNNTGYFILSIIIEEVTGQDYETVLMQKILKPLGLMNTGVDHREEILYKRAYGYVKSGQKFENADGMFMQNLQGAGNLYATIDDLFAWDRALYTDKLISQKLLDEMQSPHTKESAGWISPYTNTYGYGVGIAEVGLDKKKTTQLIFHSGHIKGFSCYFARFVEDGHTVIMLSNVGNVNTARMNDIVQEIKNVLYDLPYHIPERSLSAEMIKVIEADGIDAAIKHFYELKKSFPYEFKNARTELDELGMALLNDEQMPEAIGIFNLNVKLNPDWNSYQKLAYAHMMQGNTKEAVRYYKKSMSLNPKKSDEERAALHEAKRALETIQ